MNPANDVLSITVSGKPTAGGAIVIDMAAPVTISIDSRTGLPIMNRW